MADEVILTCSLNKSHLPVINTQQLAYVLIEAVPGEGITVASGVSPPLNLSLVLDRSGSMGGKKIKSLREAAKMVIDRLSDQDYISVAIFNDQARVLVSSQLVTDKAALQQKIGDVRDRGGTAISKGMKLGLDELKKQLDPRRVSRMLLLTDGQTFGDEDQCRKLAKKAGDKGLQITALGLGDDWNEDLLDDIAEASRGTSDFIDSPDQIMDFFQTTVQSMQATVVRNAQMLLRLVQGVQPRQIWQVVPIISNLGYQPLSDRDVQVSLGDLEEGQSYTMLVELLLPPRPEGRYRVAQAEISYDVPAMGVEGEKVKADITLDFTADQALSKGYDARVMNIVEKVTTFKLQTRALEEARMGNVAGATQKLRAAATRLLEMGEEELAEAALQEADNLEREGQMTSTGTKKLRYKTRKLTQKLVDGS